MKIKKLGAIGVASLMLMTPVIAGTLGDLPAPYIDAENQYVDTAMVVGNVGDDINARATLKTYFDGKVIIPEVVEDDDVDVEFNFDEKKTENIGLGLSLNSEFDSELDDGDIVSLRDSSIEFNNENINYREILKIGDDISVETSLTSDEEEYQSTPYIEVRRGALGYYYTFDEAIDLSEADDDEPLTIRFLGKTLKVVDIDGDNSFEVMTGDEHFLSIDQSVEIDGKLVKLVNVGSTSAVIDVSGVVATLDDGESRKVNGIWVKVGDLFDSNERSDRSATLVISTDTIYKTYDNGDAYIGEDEDDPDWVWDLSDLNTNNPVIGVVNDFVKDDYRDNPLDKEDTIVYPNGYAGVSYDGLAVDDFANIQFAIDDSLDLEEVGLGSSETGLVFTSNEEDTLVIGGEKTNEVYLVAGENETVSVFYENRHSNDIVSGGVLNCSNQTSGNLGYVDFDDTNKDINWNCYVDEFDTKHFQLIVDDITSDWTIHNGLLDRLGNDVSSDEDTELLWEDRPIGTEEDDLLNPYGIIIENPSSMGNGDEVTLRVPSDRQEVVVSIGTGEEVDDSDETVVTTEPVLVTASEASGYNNLILVGGPCVNSLTAEFMGLPFPACGVESTIAENKGIIRLIEKDGRTALIVAGWEQVDTQRAANSVVDGLSGTALTV